MKEAVLRQNTQFRTLYYRGASASNALLAVYTRKNNKGFNRVGITTGKKVGNAVARSRCRRVIRVAYRALTPQMKMGYDFVFVARSKTATVKSQEVTAAMQKLLLRLDVLQE